MIIRVQKDSINPYVVINKGFVNDVRLSAKAKGILLYLLSKPDNWRVYENDIANHMKDGKKSIRAGIQELIEHAYMEKAQLRTVGGKFDGYNYDVYETPKSNGHHIYPTGHHSEPIIGSWGYTAEQIEAMHSLAAIENRSQGG